VTGRQTFLWRLLQIMTMEKIKRIIPYAIVLMISVYFYILAGRFGFNARAGNLGPDFWPKLLLGLTMVVCLYEIAKTALFHRVKALEEDTGEEKAGAEKRYPGLLIIGTLMTVAYVYFVSILGFILCTFLYLTFFMFVGRYRKVWVIAANSVIGTLLFVVLFMKVVYVSLPLGQGPFQQFSLLVLKILGIK
jgi:putative tricarboxylic transport membrane protein